MFWKNMIFQCNAVLYTFRPPGIRHCLPVLPNGTVYQTLSGIRTSLKLLCGHFLKTFLFARLTEHIEGRIPKMCFKNRVVDIE